MDLKTFITETLGQILDGVKDAQRAQDGGRINAEGGGSPGGNLFSAGIYGMFTRVDFDVAVSAESTGSGKAGLRVFGIGAEGGGEHKTGLANRITFSVPIRLPEGIQGQAKGQGYER